MGVSGTPNILITFTSSLSITSRGCTLSLYSFVMITLSGIFSCSSISADFITGSLWNLFWIMPRFI